MRKLRHSHPILLVAFACTFSLCAASADVPATQPADAAPAAKCVPVNVWLDYILVTDYVFRGMNFSEYPGEGREKLNHQLDAGAEVETPLGTFGVNSWFEWFAGQKELDPGSKSDFQEQDYTVYWNKCIEPIATTVEFGWAAYLMAQVSGDANSTYEVYTKLSFDDSSLFGTKDPVLNPYVYYGLDIDLGDYGSWLEFGVSHPFDLSACAALADDPVLSCLTITPSTILGVDHRYLNHFAVAGEGGPATRLANLQYGLDFSYDLSKALHLGDRRGSFTVGAFLNYSEALRRDLLNDEFWGGMTVGYSW